MTEQTKNGNGNPMRNLSVILAIGSYLLGAGVQWGIAKGAQEENARHIESLQKQLEDNAVTRREYEARTKDILDRLDRIENKLDRRSRSGG
jgi:hypothetical protein